MICAGIAVLLILMFADTAIPEAGTGEYRLALIETSDIHGSLTGGENPDLEYRVAYIADKANDARRTEDGIDNARMILLDGGDIYQGSPVSLLSGGEAMSAVFDNMQYDAVAVGNHEFDWGIEEVIDDDQTMRDYTLNGKPCKNDVPVICSNLYKDGEKAGFAKDYVILNKKAADESGNTKGVRIGVIGFADEYSQSEPEKIFGDLGYSIKEDYDAVNRLAQELKGDKRCDAVILLSHGAPYKAADGLGESTPVDVVLGGHIHKNINEISENGLRCMSPAGNAYAYVYDELVFENDGSGGLRIKEGADDKAEYVRTADDRSLLLDNEKNAEELDRDAVDLSNVYVERVKPYLEKVIGYITEPVTKDYLEGSGNRVSTAGNFVCDAMRSAAGADAAFVNKAGVRTNLYLSDGSDRHEVTYYDIYALLPFDDRMYVYDITYGELLDVFDFGMNGGGWSLLTCMTGIDCFFRDDPAADQSGKYKVTMVDALVKDGVPIYHDGQWEDDWENRKLRIAVIDIAAEAEANRQGEKNPLYTFNDTERLVSNDRLLRDAVIEALEAEAAENNGHLHVRTDTCFRYENYESE